MAGTGTIVNTGAVIIGSLVGLFFKRRISEKMNEVLMQALALCTMAVGLVGIVQGGTEIAEGGLASRNTLIMILGMVIGTILGQAIDIDRRLNSFGNFLQGRLAKSGGGDFSRAFVTATLTVCVGAMAIVGSLNDGLNHDPSVLLAKSVLDCVICMIFGSTLGIGTVFAAAPLFLYQGGITLFASFLQPLLTDAVIAQMTLIGSVLIMGIGFNFVYRPQLKLANMLPAVFIPPIWYGITALIK